VVPERTDCATEEDGSGAQPIVTDTVEPASGISDGRAVLVIATGRGKDAMGTILLIDESASGVGWDRGMAEFIVEMS
jgi:hypothetical protein